MSITIFPTEWTAAPSRVRGSSTLGSRVKRPIDLIAAWGGLIALLPVFVLIAMAIKLETRGPVLYRQERVGLNRRRRWKTTDRERRQTVAYGRPFEIYKFRSMVVDAERHTGPVWATAKDSRVTRVGKFLRRTRLDETPQLWNVVRGEMSIVGPRPERPTFVDTLTTSIPDYPKRCGAMPGITGLAQVRSCYDTSIDSVRRKLRYDLYYLNHGCLLLDLKIMAATVKVMARGDGAH